MNDTLQKVENFFKRYHTSLKERLSHNRKLFENRVWLCDFHSHTEHSDGSASVEEMSGWAGDVGLDLLAVTDHNTLSQFEECQEFANLICGQEVKVGDHHYVALGHNHEVLDDEAGPMANLECVQAGNGILFIPHPTGWMSHHYDPEVYADLDFLSKFGFMEIGNGAVNFVNYWDVTDRRAVELWDRILSEGKRMIGFGNSDAHLPLELGIVFNGLLEKPDIPSTLKDGNHFVSNGPFINLKACGHQMGSSFENEGQGITISVEAVDCEGLMRICVVRDGHRIWTTDPQGKKKSRVFFRDTPPAGSKSYYRAECYAVDGNRAFSNPIWID